MPVEWDFLRGPLASVRMELLAVLAQYARHKRAFTVGISANPLLTFLEHAEDRELGPDQYLGNRLVCIYETPSLDEAVSARDLLLAHARENLHALCIAPDGGSGLSEQNDDLPYFVYLRSDSICQFPRKERPQR